MRCPKCGFISFDDQIACGKCQIRIDCDSLAFQGTAIHVEPLFFLGSAGAADTATAAEQTEEVETALDNSADLYQELAAESLHPGFSEQPHLQEEELDLSSMESGGEEELSFAEPEVEEELVLEFEEEAPEESATAAPAGTREAEGVASPAPLNFEEIDLSDLVSEPETTMPLDAADAEQTSAESIFDLSDIISENEEGAFWNLDQAPSPSETESGELDELPDLDFTDAETAGRQPAPEPPADDLQPAPEAAQPTLSSSGLTMENDPRD